MTRSVARAGNRCHSFGNFKLALHASALALMMALPCANAALPAATGSVPALRADFGAERPSSEARLVANWAIHSGDNMRMSVIVVDKRFARVYVFGPDGKLRGAAPALLGLARGDDSIAGIGDKPLSQVRPEERTTPAGRFIAQAGVNSHGEDIVWVDYDLAVSMHRVRALVPAERRLERLASPAPAEHRISYGCINLPPAFYEHVVRASVRNGGAVIYVLPETRPAREMFGAYDLPADPAPVALRPIH